jgi:nicotinate phosphoribosyltransferase
LRFTDDDVAYLRSLKTLSEAFMTWLRGFAFTGDVMAVPEGTPVFANEPILEIVAPIEQAQLVETLVMNHIHVNYSLLRRRKSTRSTTLLRRAGSLIASVSIWVGATTAVLREFVAYGCGIACTSG